MNKHKDVGGAVNEATREAVDWAWDKAVSMAVRRDVYGTVDDAMRGAANRSIDWVGWAAVDRTHPQLDGFLQGLRQEGHRHAE